MYLNFIWPKRRRLSYFNATQAKNSKCQDLPPKKKSVLLSDRMFNYSQCKEKPELFWSSLAYSTAADVSKDCPPYLKAGKWHLLTADYLKLLSYNYLKEETAITHHKGQVHTRAESYLKWENTSMKKIYKKHNTIEIFLYFLKWKYGKMHCTHCFPVAFFHLGTIP